MPKGGNQDGCVWSAWVVILALPFSKTWGTSQTCFPFCKMGVINNDHGIAGIKCDNICTELECLEAQ
jgi:hypothetical protein